MTKEDSTEEQQLRKANLKIAIILGVIALIVALSPFYFLNRVVLN